MILRYGAPVGSIVELYPRLDRCMSQLKTMIGDCEDCGDSLAAGTVVIADSLTGSSGRFARKWHAPAGGAWLAVAWPDIFLPEFTRLLPFAVGLACCRTVRHYQIDARLKWVNDIVVSGKKIGGILCETVLSKQGERFHLLGIGINVNNTRFPKGLQNISVSMAELLPGSIERNQFLGRLLAELTLSLGMLHHDEALFLQRVPDGSTKLSGHVMQWWQQLCDSQGRLVVFGHDVQKKPLYQARVTGFDHTGGVVLTLQNGETVVESSGEIRYLDSDCPAESSR